MCNNHNIREFDYTIELADNAMLKVRPELFYEWDFEKNDELGLDVYRVTKGSHKVTWWNCFKCGSPYDKQIAERVKGQNCPYCRGLRVNHTNSLASLNPKLASEWHPILNGDLTPHDVTYKSKKKVWWIGECGHEWDALIIDRTKNNNKCPYCSNHRLLVGFNDMWTTNPELAKFLDEPENGYKYTQCSSKKVDWKCKQCGEIIRDKAINNVNYKGLSCPNCSDGKSYPEKVIYNLLKQLNIEFECEKIFDWAKNKRYDFYLSNYSTLIEVNGRQHYDKEFKQEGARTLKEEQENDRIKEKLAKENGIDKYIVIDASESNIDYIKRSIINSDLNKFLSLKNINWSICHEKSCSSLIKIVCELWNKQCSSTTELSKLLNISNNSVVKYLKQGSKIGWCTYDAVINKSNVSKFGNKFSRKVVQLTNTYELINEFISIKGASKHINISSSIISACCKGKYKTAGGYKWMYKEDYDKLIHNQEAI